MDRLVPLAWSTRQPDAHGAHTIAELAVEGRVYVLVGQHRFLLYVFVCLTEGEGSVVDGGAADWASVLDISVLYTCSLSIRF